MKHTKTLLILFLLATACNKKADAPVIPTPSVGDKQEQGDAAPIGEATDAVEDNADAERSN